MEPIILASFWRGLAATIFVIICALLMFVILIQRGRGGGLSAAFGGGGSQSAFGAKTGDVFTWITVVLAVLFITVSCLLNYVFQPLKAGSSQPPAAVQQPEVPAQPSEQSTDQPAGPSDQTW